jgi:Ca2+-transporting ATPase
MADAKIKWFQSKVEKVIAELETSETGLTEEEVAKRKTKYGRNTIRTQKGRGLWSILFAQLKSPVVYLLVAASIVSFSFSDFTEGIAILLVIVINTAIAFIMEKQAMQSMQALKKLDKTMAKVIRNGNKIEVLSEELVPGDLLFVEAGDIISADARLIKVSLLEVDESALTGESLPVGKNTPPLQEGTPLAERNNMLYKGTAITRGNGKAIVVATAMKTELGQISAMVQSAQSEEIPLNKKLETFSRKLIWLVVIIALPISLVGVLGNRDLYLMIETAIALAVAAIPEGLPIVATISLARGMLRLAKHKVIVKKLAAVETLGETNVIFTDKTGTLTENKLEVHTIFLSDEMIELKWEGDKSTLQIVPKKKPTEENINHLLEVAVLCNNANYSKQSVVGDPLEVALLKFALSYGKSLISDLNEKTQRLKEQPFDSDSKVMATLDRKEGQYFVSAKGATEELQKLCSHTLIEGQVTSMSKEHATYWQEKTDEIASKGLKVLAFAYRELDEKKEEWLSDLVFIGLVGFLDPARVDVPEAISACKRAGIKVIMVTGDHPETARTIAHKVGIIEKGNATVLHGRDIKSIDKLSIDEKNALGNTLVFSRVSPVQKLELIQIYKERGDIVAMTGDGVNDAPALKKADIGIAMGIRGTQVARESADMVLQDDAFPSIVRAIRQGRVIFKNIKNFIIYLMSCNLSEIMVVSIASFANLALPLLPLQILFLNIVNDVFPALALGMGEGNKTIMDHPPHDPKEALINKRNWASIIVYALVLTMSVLSVFFYSLFYKGYSGEICNSISFFTLAFAQLLHPISLIGAKENLIKNDIVRNPHLWAAVVFCIAIILAVFLIPYTREILNLQALGFEAWVSVAIGSVAPVFIIRVLKMVRVID